MWKSRKWKQLILLREIRSDFTREVICEQAGVSNLLAFLGHSGRRIIILGHTLNTVRHVITHKKIS